MADSTTRPTTATWAALGGGLVLLALMVAFAVGLPHVNGDDDTASAKAGAPALPDQLTGGWTALADAATAGGASDGASDGASPAAETDQNKQALAYVNTTLGKVYDEPTEFQAYVDKSGAKLVTATLFDATGGAFAPANGVADPTMYGLDRAPIELTRHGAAVCIANYQSAAQSSGSEQVTDPTPLSVSCQEPAAGATVQIGSTDMSVDDTVALLDDLAKRVAAV